MASHLPALLPFLDPVRVHQVAGLVRREAALAQLTALVGRDWDGERRDGFLAAITAREEVTTTGVGGGFAIPHARTSWLVTCRIALGIYPDGTDWPSLDLRTVRVVALMAVRESDHQEHLRIMAALTVALRRPGLIDRLVAVSDPVGVVGLLAGDR